MIQSTETRLISSLLFEEMEVRSGAHICHTPERENVCGSASN